MARRKKTRFVTSDYLLPKGKATTTVRQKGNFHGSAALCSPQPGGKFSTGISPSGCACGVSALPSPLGVRANLRVPAWL